MHAEYDAGVVRLKEPPSAPHEAAHGAVNQEVTMSLTVSGAGRSFKWMGSTRYWWTAFSKVADQCFLPSDRTLAGQPSIEPTL
ncbi:hypothetical protein HK097_010481, partial [Rhizophlyctis rosea]